MLRARSMCELNMTLRSDKVSASYSCCSRHTMNIQQAWDPEGIKKHIHFSFLWLAVVGNGWGKSVDEREERDSMFFICLMFDRKLMVNISCRNLMAHVHNVYDQCAVAALMANATFLPHCGCPYTSACASE